MSTAKRKRSGCNFLTTRKVESEKRPGYYADGNGLYLQVASHSDSITKSWVFRYSFGGKRRDMGLGSVKLLSLEDARIKAIEYKRMARIKLIDPIEARTAEKQAAFIKKAKTITFADAADKCIKAKEHGWRNIKHAQQWRNTLQTYAYPVFGDLSVQSIDISLVLKVLEPIWITKTETATRLRGRIANVLDWATVSGFREGNNPAKWTGNLDQVLASPDKLQITKHHAALPYQEIGQFMQALRKQDGVAAIALQFLILTACRTSEVLAATWEEIDFSTKVWTIPADRMKAAKVHTVPLSDVAIDLLKRQRDYAIGEHVFPGLSKRKFLSNTAMLALLKRMGRGDLTAHGFRSTFRDWAAESTAFPREAAEMALAHAIENKVEAAYRRGDLLEKRRQLMNAWADYCARPATVGEVIAIRANSH